MKRIAWIVIGCLALAMAAQAASFDCAKASTNVERMICGNAELSKLDDELLAAYRTALQDETQADFTKHTQKLWMKLRNACSDVACVKDQYTARLTMLRATRNLEYSGKHGINYVADASAMDGNVFEHENTDDVCGVYLQNLQYFAKHALPMSCGQPITPSLKDKLEKVEWEDIDPEKFPVLFREVVETRLSKDKVVTDDEIRLLRNKVTSKEYVFRRARVTLIGHPDTEVRSSLSQWAKDYVNQYQGRSVPELKLTIVQFGANINDPDNPNEGLRCNLEQVRGGWYFSDKPSFMLVTDNLSHLYEYIQVVRGEIPQYLWRINGRLYGEGLGGGDIYLSEFGDAVKKDNLDRFFFEPVCLFHYKQNSDAGSNR